MSEAHAFSASEPSESMSWQEICQRYPDQWVALVEIVWIDEDEVRAARVAGHGPRRVDPLEQARHLHSRYEDRARNLSTKCPRSTTSGSAVGAWRVDGSALCVAT